MDSGITIYAKNYLKDLQTLFDNLDLSQLEKIEKTLISAYKNKDHIFIIGNGGSASTASHLTCDLAKTVIAHKGDSRRLGFKTICLAENIPLITAWSNDVDYECIFEEQLKNLANKNDVLIAISASGNSPNIINCAKAAKELGMSIIGLTGFGGGKLAKIADTALVVDSYEYGPVEDIHLVISHILTFHFQHKFK